MENIIQVTYGQTGSSTVSDTMGMREMQQKAFQARNNQLLLIKAPPASGKSRALMFIALDKLVNQGIKKVIVAVPERSIGSSFARTDLMSHGFFADWEPNELYNLCTPGLDGSKTKVDAFVNFMRSDEKILICTHATLRFAYEALEDSDFNDCLLAIDEFHHVSADGSNILGSVLRSLINNSSVHLVAMTGSYFRGDSIPVLAPEDEAKFAKVTYNYYQQLNGYKYLKSLGIGYHFYQGKYHLAINEVLDTDKKTILHIPNVNSGESTKDKYDEVDRILDMIGEIESVDPETGIIHVRRRADGKVLKVADLVNDDAKQREKIVNYLRDIQTEDDMDLIIALGMAKEGFDWPYCEHALTVGYRGSLTEIVQIIGRATRDSANKTHAQFTNLLAKPDTQDDNVVVAVNNMLKAITASLLMEQVLAPNFNFKPKRDENEIDEPGTIKIKGFKGLVSKRVKDIVEEDINDLKAAILQDKDVTKALSSTIDAEVINKVLIPKVIKMRYPDLEEEELEAVRQYVVTDSAVKTGTISEVGDQKFITLANQFINIEDISINLIDTINPFQRAFEVISKSVTVPMLKAIQDVLLASKIKITEEEALLTWPSILAFVKEQGREPDVHSADLKEQRYAEVLLYIRDKKRKSVTQNG
ncbi:DEAD/DEAH box helicase [Sphingobacterium thalpophilum]|uniref:DEAD/DEAH box helicase n=1 Tax=Sphingobacterium thalpophilum TaxID=259 RepID=A0ACD5C0E0_9SPHI